MTQRHEALVGSWNMDNRLEVQQDVNDFESFYAEKVRYPNNREWSLKEREGGDDVTEMGEMLGPGERLSVQIIEAVHLEGEWEAIHGRRGVILRCRLGNEFENR